MYIVDALAAIILVYFYSSLSNKKIICKFVDSILCDKLLKEQKDNINKLYKEFGITPVIIYILLEISKVIFAYIFSILFNINLLVVGLGGVLGNIFPILDNFKERNSFTYFIILLFVYFMAAHPSAIIFSLIIYAVTYLLSKNEILAEIITIININLDLILVKSYNIILLIYLILLLYYYRKDIKELLTKSHSKIYLIS